jgi:hypothetical protein
MHILHVEHDASPNYDAWKQAFDSDPLGRQQSGVRRYWVSRAIDDPNHVMIDLMFETQEEAEGFRASLRDMWQRGDSPMRNPSARTVELAEMREY